jgi:hypothetical protein
MIQLGVWKGSWTFLLVGLSMGVLSINRAAETKTTETKRVREEKLAGLRPGKDTVDQAYKHFGEGDAPKSDSLLSWRDDCNHQQVSIAFDPRRIIESVTVERPPGTLNADCELKAYSRPVRAKLGSGHDLVMRDRCQRIREIYGEPDAKATAARGFEKLDIYTYQYSWAGERPRLTMEVTCNVTIDQIYGIKLFVAEK